MKKTNDKTSGIPSPFFFAYKLFKLEAFNNAIDLDPDMAATYYLRGVTYGAIGFQDRAIADLETCIELTQDPLLAKAAQQRIEEILNPSVC